MNNHYPDTDYEEGLREGRRQRTKRNLDRKDLLRLGIFIVGVLFVIYIYLAGSGII